MARKTIPEAASDIFARVLHAPAVQSVAQRLELGEALSLNSVPLSAQPFVVALLRKLAPARPILVLCDNLKSQETVLQDLTTWIQAQSEKGAPVAGQPLFFPAWETLPHEARLPHPDVISDRLETLAALSESSGALPIVVANVTALLQKTFSPAQIREGTKKVVRGQRIDPLDLIEWLEAQGYEPEAQVTHKGEIALRGGILDLFPLTSPWPVRLEFFGDELESLRYFDPFTQISREQVAQVLIPPGGELALLKQRTGGGATNGTTSPELSTILEHLPADTLIVFLEPELLEARVNEYSAQMETHDPFSASWEETQGVLESKSFLKLEICEAPEGGGRGKGELDEGGERQGGSEAQQEGGGRAEELRLTSLELFRPMAERIPDPQVAEAQRREFFGQLHRWLRQGFAVEVFCNNQGEKQRFAEIWAEYGLDAQSAGPLGQAGERPAKNTNVPDAGLTLRIGTLSRGFLFEAARLVVVTDAEIFGRYRVQRPRRLKSPHAQAARSALDIDFTELEEGDYVVHLQHGIGKYLGLTVLPGGAGTKPTEGGATLPGSGQECLVIEYAPSDPTQPAPKLYVPVTEAHLVGKYVGTGKARPPLNTLGGTRWAKAKAQAERAVRDVASELLAIQAARESQPGHSFKLDSPWQREFEGAFIFEETPDQLKAIEQTKADMERPKPMDRLICGDVGFGKTEVGIRAAFKAVMDGKQVAILVPTTVLAQQHFNTFSERMSDYPVRIELLSRFRTRRMQQKVIAGLAAGAVDIVIGTHRLIQSDISFKDLGLVIIDEEQRFGVMHKEKFKLLRRLVDVLTLSATPIPRTLYLALTGARDMSTIQTPPHDRLPVETIVTHYDERIIRDAIQRELGRGGQVFFLHNRVATIEAIAIKLRDLVPQARIVVGHGQMHADDLEEVMTKFVDGQADILLSTTIIESGLDIPNANTIIIDRADRFGLSDLYQLRGRVGRYKHQAYAYLLLPRHAGLLADARKRLSAIKQYSSLGSGFKIAMRDLEIRGAGNLLGAEQSGHITAVGFELYCQLLKQSVASLKGEKVKPRIDVQVRLDFLSFNPAEVPVEETQVGKKSARRELAASVMIKEAEEGLTFAYVPFRYASDSRQRIEIYRKLAQVEDQAGLKALETELRDRFGPIPAPVQLLFQVADLKIVAATRGISLIEVKDEKIMLTRNGEYVMAGSKFPRLSKKEAAARLKEIKQLLLALAPVRG